MVNVNVGGGVMMCKSLCHHKNVLDKMNYSNANGVRFIRLVSRSVRGGIGSQLLENLRTRDAARWCPVQYLAWSLKRSKAVNGCQRVVGVIGKGHLRGVVHALLHDQHNLRFKDLVGARGTFNGHPSRTQQLRKLAKNLAVETAIGFLLWWAWDSFQHH